MKIGQEHLEISLLKSSF